MRLLVASDSHRAAGNLLDIVELHLEDSDVLYTHGHPFHVKFGLAELEQAAREAHADICLFGHTHQQMTDYRDGVYLMNPGAVAEGCYGMVDITPGGIMLLPCRL